MALIPSISDLIRYILILYVSVKQISMKVGSRVYTVLRHTCMFLNQCNATFHQMCQKGLAALISSIPLKEQETLLKHAGANKNNLLVYIKIYN